jgi:alpha-mannosidase
VGIQSLSSRISIAAEPGTTPIVVFNPHAWPVRTVVETEFGGLKATDGLLDDAGEAVPFQPTQSYATVSAWRSRLAIDVELPPLGYRTYRVVPDRARVLGGSVAATPTSLENEHLRLEIDPATGRIVHLRLRRDGADVDGVDLSDASRPRALVVDDTSDTWGHRRISYQDVIGEFETTQVTLVESGAARAILRVESRYGRSELVEDFVLAAGDPAVEVRVVLDWHERARMLKLRFPSGLDGGVATFDIPYGTIERPTDGEEEPGQRWVDVSTGTAGLAVLNDGKYGFDVQGSEIGVTAVRSPIYAHHEPRVPTPGVRYQFMDIGQQRFRLGLLPHAGGWADAGIGRRAALLNLAPTVLLESYHDGPLPPQASYAQVEPDDLVLGSVKLAEDADDLVVRVVETAGRAADARVTFPAFGRELAFPIGPYEIRTWRVPLAEVDAAYEVDLLERPLAAEG